MENETDLTVLGPDFSFNLPSVLQVTISAPGAISDPNTLTVVGINGYNATINFTPNSCTIVPAGSESSCSFNPASITGSGTTQVTISTTAPHASLLTPIPMLGGLNLFVAVGTVVATLLLLLFSGTRRRRWGLVLGLILVTALVSMATSCGSSSSGVASDPGTRTNVAYQVTVSGFAPSIQIGHSIQFDFIVQ